MSTQVKPRAILYTAKPDVLDLAPIGTLWHAIDLLGTFSTYVMVSTGWVKTSQ